MSREPQSSTGEAISSCSTSSASAATSSRGHVEPGEHPAVAAVPADLGQRGDGDVRRRPHARARECVDRVLGQERVLGEQHRGAVVPNEAGQVGEILGAAQGERQPAFGAGGLDRGAPVAGGRARPVAVQVDGAFVAEGHGAVDERQGGRHVVESHVRDLGLGLVPASEGDEREPLVDQPLELGAVRLLPEQDASVGQPQPRLAVEQPPGAVLDRRAGEEQQVAAAKAEGVRGVNWYQFHDSVLGNPQIADPANVEYHFGLMNRDLSAKPSLLAYANAARLLDDAVFGGWLEFGEPQTKGLYFESPGGDLAVLWNRADGFILNAGHPDEGDSFPAPEVWVEPGRRRPPCRSPPAVTPPSPSTPSGAAPT